MSARRTPILVVVTALLVAGGVADRAGRDTTRVSTAAADRSLMPTSAPADALSSTWFCVGSTAEGTGIAEGVVVVANPGAREATGRITVVPVGGETRSAPLVVAPGTVARVKLQDVSPASWAAAMVDLDAGQVGAELVTSGSGDSDATPCSSRASDRWYFADGVTAKDAGLVLSLFNPFPEDAIVELSFSTDQGRTSPVELSPVVIPGRSLVVRDIGSHVRRRDAIATTVRARAGRVVAAQTQVRTAGGKAGMSVSLGAPSLGTEWHFPEGALADGMSEHFAIYNPGSTEADVLVQVILDEGVVGEFDQAVPARDRIDVVLNEELGVPRNVGHSVSVIATGGDPVVVSRTLEFAEPNGRRGRADTLGARRAATRWLFAAGSADGDTDEVLVVANTGQEDATVSVASLSAGALKPVQGLTSHPVGAGQRWSVKVRDHVQGDPLPLVVTSSVPVVVERAVYAGGSPGVWATMGIPLG